MKCDFLQTRILSVFNILKRVGFALLLLGVNVYAQPQAPIAWQEMEVLYSDAQWPVSGITAEGDTIVLHSFTYDTTLHYYYPALTVSGNNGVSWSPWHVFTDDRTNWMSSPVAITSQGIYCATVHYPSTQIEALSSSVDLGQTWQDPCTTSHVRWLVETYGDTIFGRYANTSLTWTFDGGCSFIGPVVTGLTDTGVQGIAYGGGWIHVVATRTDVGRGRVLYYTRALITTGVFEEPRDLLPDIYWARTAHLECDEEGTVIVLAPIDYAPPLPLLATQMVAISRDYGTTWTERDTLTLIESATFFKEEITHDGHRWLASWEDTTHSEGFEHGGRWFAFSANRGKSWYPSRQIEDDNLGDGGISCIELREVAVRIYGAFSGLNGNPADVFVRWQGEIEVDLTVPIVIGALSIPELVPGDTLLSLGISATDNDSLWRAEFVARRVDQPEDSVVIQFQRDGEVHFSGEWQVPGDTAVWLCYYRAEDMWENVTTTEVQTVYVGAISRVEPSQPNVEEFRISTFPNPFNSTLSISLDVPLHQEVTLSLYDLLGREVDVVYRGRLATSTISYVAPAAMASGVYFLRASAGDVSVLGKVVLLK